MMHISELQQSELDPKLFSESWIIFIQIIGKVYWVDNHCPPVRDVLVILIMTKELVQ
jgi:hypothetical protein